MFTRAILVFAQLMYQEKRKSMKKRLYEILIVSKRTGDLSWWFDLFIITLICLNVLAIVIESVGSLRSAYGGHFRAFEVFSVAVFTVEYVLRLWTANVNPRYAKPVAGNLKYAATPMAIIDLLAILPFYLPLLGIDLRFLRIIRIFRLFLLFKFARYIKAVAVMGNVVREKKEELIVSIVFTLFMLLIASTLMYYVESPAQPDTFSSIPETMWWGIATLTTVGYGDIYPITPLGKTLGGIIALIGIGLFALPTGILASGFSDELARRKESPACPHCGETL